MPYQLLADIVLLAHFAIVLFVVLGLPVIIIGNSQRWTWVNNAWWRVPHLAAIVTVVLRAWLGVNRQDVVC
jgi:energy-converting hydrogenase Eha subunit A